MTTGGLPRLRRFVGDMGDLVVGEHDEAHVLEVGEVLLADLVQHDDWLPDEFAEAGLPGYRQYLLHCDSRHAFSVVSFVWGPGQRTPVHNHTVWGLVGVLRGAEIATRVSVGSGCLEPDGRADRLEPGDVEAVSPRIGDIHQVQNGHADRTSVSIHVYGADIGAVERSTFTEEAVAVPFVSGYSNEVLPNLWGGTEGT